MPFGQLPHTPEQINLDWSRLGREGPTLHRAVRQAYSAAIHDWHTQRQAFDAAVELVRRHAQATSDEEARRLVAHMLSEEPQRETSEARLAAG